MVRIQLLVDGEQNRSALRELLDDNYEVVIRRSVAEVDVYVVDDRSMSTHLEALRDRIDSVQPVFCPVLLIRRDEGGRDVPLRSPDGDGPLLVDDIVEAPVTQAQLLRRLETLRIRREQSAQLRKYVTRLERSNERLEQFAYAASHDLQEPLRMVTSYLRLIENRYEVRLDENGTEYLEYAVDGADRMREMIDGLLKYSRIDSKGKRLEATDLESVVEDVLTDLQMKIDERDAELEIDPLPTVAGDPNQLRQLFQNLVSNAIEYSDDDRPHVEIEATRRRSMWAVSVSDDGIGIDPNHQEKIFEVFERLHSRQEYAGTGIGLALCERIVERHGGSIRVNSVPGDGSTFTFTLPPASTPDLPAE